MLQFALSSEEQLYLVLSPADVEAYNDLLTNTQVSALGGGLYQWVGGCDGVTV